MIDQPEYTRCDVKRMAPNILGRYHDLVCTNNLAGYEKMLDEYRVPLEEREELLREFKLLAEDVLRRRWRPPGSR